jgi:hypothetical protein
VFCDLMIDHEGMCSFSLLPEFPVMTRCALHITVSLSLCMMSQYAKGNIEVFQF